MIKARLKFKRTDELKFLSHLDQHRLFVRALRRAELPMAFSQGFNPHPIIAFANAMSVGMTGDSEYIDISLNEESEENTISSTAIKKKLNAVLPGGIRILEAEIIPAGSKSLAKLVEYADYDIICLGLHVNDFDEFSAKLEKFSNKKEILISKRNKKGTKVKKDIKKSFEEITVERLGKDVIFHLRIIPVSGSLLSPETVIKTFLKSIDYYNKSVNMLIHRKHLALSEKN